MVIGAGMGGLVLAQGLRNAGIEVTVHERDTALEQTGGYRLHVNPAAVDVLRRRLPTPVFQAVVASSTGPESFRQFGVLDHRLRQVARIPRGRDGEHLMIGRVALRRLLGHDLAEVIRFGSEFTGLEHNADGTVTAMFADGTRDTADVLVGADGARSRVVAALAGRFTARKLKAFGLAGKAPLSREIRSDLPSALRYGPAFAVAPTGTAVFLTLHDPATASPTPRAHQRVSPIIEDGYVLWSVVVPDPAALSAAPAAEHGRPDVLASARHLLTGFAPWTHTVLDRTDPAQAGRFDYYAADPEADLTPWQSGAATAIGDAVHAMPPTGGQGASTAIRDADLLISQLTGLHDSTGTHPCAGPERNRSGTGGDTVTAALHTYQQSMTRYAVPALRESLQPLRWQQRLTSPLARPLLHAVLAITGSASHLRRTAPLPHPSGHGG
ncbi:FAD-dependent oxidoreductase [Streptomyces sp. NPDC058459]|uniref:FAD-dependent oxidoreductase n=1 Tax=Streptomyces sp. NPDC058459 TaxID=3346508 RepID=UPI003654004E